MSNIVCNFVENITMLKFLEKLVEVFQRVPHEKNVLYVELDSVRYEDLLKEVEGMSESIEQKHVPDFGDCAILTFMGYKFIISCDKRLKTQQEVINIAFKIKPDDRAFDRPSSEAENDQK
jgi:hypothetical protein